MTSQHHKNSHICPYLQTLDLQNMHKSFRKHFVFLELVHSGLFNICALTLLAGHQEKHPACKNCVMRCWHGHLSGARGRFFAYGSADATAIPKPHRLLPHLNPDWFYLSGTSLPKLTRKRPLNGYSVAVVFHSRLQSLYKADRLRHRQKSDSELCTEFP